ncbi:MAG: hypothetical protein NT166_08840 [Candidatus Aminicenantes bacterium]|nr:hypothetical protein [Candidatus Aminicenantes bacterium]
MRHIHERKRRIRPKMRRIRPEISFVRTFFINFARTEHIFGRIRLFFLGIPFFSSEYIVLWGGYAFFSGERASFWGGYASFFSAFFIISDKILVFVGVLVAIGSGLIHQTRKMNRLCVCEPVQGLINQAPTALRIELLIVNCQLLIVNGE